MESLAPEVAPFGIRTMLVEPGFFRTELLTPESTKYAASSIEDYAERTRQTVSAWKGMNGQQGGDPAKLADALVYLACQVDPPLRFAASADAVAAFERRAKNLLAQGDAYRDLSSSLAPRYGLSHPLPLTECVTNCVTTRPPETGRLGCSRTQAWRNQRFSRSVRPADTEARVRDQEITRRQSRERLGAANRAA